MTQPEIASRQLLDQVPKGRGEACRAVRHDEYEEVGT
jgi:hypothetical protein